MSYRDLKCYQQGTIIHDFTVLFCDRYIEGRAVRTDWTNRTDKTYQTNETDLPYRFYSRQSDQMIQAARSGKQNIVEGAKEKNSQTTEMKLTSVGRASFEELLQDFEDFLRQHGLRQWEKEDPRALKVRSLYKLNTINESNRTDWINWSNYLPYLDNPEDAANAAICLIHQANFLTDRLMGSQREKFVQQGGWSENLRREREAEKKKKVMEWMKNRRS